MTRKEIIEKAISDGCRMKEIGEQLGGISRQRVYQLILQYGLSTPERKKSGFWKQQTKPSKWLWRTLCKTAKRKKLSMDEVWEIWYVLSKSMPEECPVLGIKLNYESGKPFIDSPSLDRKNPNLGYTIDNIQIISMRANFCKSNLTLEELQKVVAYLTK